MLNVYVVEPMSMDEVKGLIVDNAGVSALSTDHRPVNVIHTGPIDAYAHRHRERASPCGISVGHGDITAGTQGVLARGRSGPRRNRLLLLSNNHVLANVNAAQAGDPIYQPGKADLALEPANQIGILEQWVTISFSAANFVDCATAWCWPDRVRPEFIFRKGSQWDYFKVEPTPVGPTENMAVGKSGRTTQLTTGQIIGISESVPVNMGDGRIANFSDQISIRGNGSTMFSRGGDSGSLIWTFGSRRRPVRLLFAGGRPHYLCQQDSACSRRPSDRALHLMHGAGQGAEQEMSDMADRHVPHSGPVQYTPQEQVSAERNEAQALLRSVPGVKGVGEGRDQIGNPAWIAYVQGPEVTARLPARIGDRSVVSEVSGEIDILPA